MDWEVGRGDQMGRSVLDRAAINWFLRVRRGRYLRPRVSFWLWVEGVTICMTLAVES